MLTQDEFVDVLRDALGHLHDPTDLSKSPLIELFEIADRSNVYAALQRILTDAIASLEPAPDVPADSRAWRVYDLLSCRYVQELSVSAVANQLGLSERHLYREQQVALKTLGDRLWKQYRLDSKQQTTPETATDAAEGPTVGDELAWLSSEPLDAPTNTLQAIRGAMALIQPLADKHGVCLRFRGPECVPDLAVHPVALNQILLSLLGVAIRQGKGGQVKLLVHPQDFNAVLEIHSRCFYSTPPAKSQEDEDNLLLAQRLIEACRGRMKLPVTDAPCFEATLILPAFERTPVLAIDDNLDTLTLLQRYASGTRYRLVTAQDPREALSLAERASPKIIVLDVMMPQIDGWKVLTDLRQHPRTADIPIIVCTIIAQEELALTLGASGFVRKPVSQRVFLSALDAQAEAAENDARAAPGSH